MIFLFVCLIICLFVCLIILSNCLLVHFFFFQLSLNVFSVHLSMHWCIQTLFHFLSGIHDHHHHFRRLWLIHSLTHLFVYLLVLSIVQMFVCSFFLLSTLTKYWLHSFVNALMHSNPFSLSFWHTRSSPSLSQVMI